MVVRFDRATTTNFKRVGDRLQVVATFSKVGDLKYQRADGSVETETLTAEELFRDDSLETAGLVPVTYGHPSVGLVGDSWSQYSVGATGSKVFARQDEGFVDVVMVIGDRRVIADAEEAAKQGKPLEVSAGYTTEIVRVGDKNYQTNRRYDHIAVLPPGQRARAGADARLHMDSADSDVAVLDEPIETTDKSCSSQRNTDMGMKKWKGFDLPEEAYDAVTEMEEEMAALKADMDKMKTDMKGMVPKVELETEMDAANKKLDALNAELSGYKIKNALDSAKHLLPENFKVDAADSVQAVQQAVVGKYLPNKRFDSEEALNAAFDVVLAMNPIEKEDAKDDVDPIAEDVKTARTGGNRGDSTRNDWEEYRREMESAWKKN